MRNVILLAALCAALPLATRAQDQPAPSSQQPDKPSQQPDKPQAPALEKPGMAAPDPEKPEKKPADAKKPDPKKPAEAKQPDLAAAKTVEEIIARVNNETITRPEQDKA